MPAAVFCYPIRRISYVMSRDLIHNGRASFKFNPGRCKFSSRRCGSHANQRKAWSGQQQDFNEMDVTNADYHRLCGRLKTALASFQRKFTSIYARDIQLPETKQLCRMSRNILIKLASCDKRFEQNFPGEPPTPSASIHSCRYKGCLESNDTIALIRGGLTFRH
jgi:hypothetical protein